MGCCFSAKAGGDTSSTAEGSQEPLLEPQDTMASVHDWLEGVEVGYGGQFAAAFEEVGAEDAADIADFGVDEISSVEALLLRAGAKQLHVKKIREAIAREVGGSFVSREASADAHDGSSTSRRKGSSAFAKSVPRRSSIVDAEVRQ